MTRLKIRTRLALLSGALLLVLALTTGYLTHRISAESAAMVSALIRGARSAAGSSRLMVVGSARKRARSSSLSP